MKLRLLLGLLILAALCSVAGCWNQVRRVADLERQVAEKPIPTDQEVAERKAHLWLDRLLSAHPASHPDKALFVPFDDSMADDRASISGFFQVGDGPRPVAILYDLYSSPSFDGRAAVFGNQVMSFTEMSLRLGSALNMQPNECLSAGLSLSDLNHAFTGTMDETIDEMSTIKPDRSVHVGLIIAGHGTTFADGTYVAGAMPIRHEIEAMVQAGGHPEFIGIEACNPIGDGGTTDVRALMANVGYLPARFVWTPCTYSSNNTTFRHATQWALTEPALLLRPRDAQWGLDGNDDMPVSDLPPYWLISRAEIQPRIPVAATVAVCRYCFGLIGYADIGEQVGHELTVPVHDVHGAAPWAER